MRPSMSETTALGAAMAAGHACGVWDLESDGAKVTTDVFTTSISDIDRDDRFGRWKEAVKRSMHWVPPTKNDGKSSLLLYIAFNRKGHKTYEVPRD